MLQTTHLGVYGDLYLQMFKIDDITKNNFINSIICEDLMYVDKSVKNDT